MKRLLIALVSVAMLTAIGTVAWSSATEEQAVAPAADEMVTVTLLQRQDPLGVGDFRTRGLYQVILDRFALDVEARLMANQPFREQFKLIIAAGDMPDMLAGVSGTTIDELNQWGTDGLLYPVDTLMHVAPELQRFYAQYPDAADYNRAPDAHTYNIPGGYDTPIFYHGTAVRKDLLDSVGFDLDGVKDFDDYIDMYRALMGANDGKPVMSTRSGVGGLMALPMKAVGLDGPSTISFDDEADRFFFPYTSDAARFAVGWVRQLYEEGILHADALIHGEDDWEPDMGELVYPALFHDCVFCFTYNNEERYKREHPESPSNFVAVKPPEYQGELQPWRNRRVGTGIEIILNADLPAWKAERIMGMLDWFRGEEGHAVSLFGIEGEDWVLLDGLPRQLYARPGNEYVFPEEWQSKVKSAEEFEAWDDNWGYIKFAGDVAQKAWQLGSQHLKNADSNKFLNDYVPKYSQVYAATPAPRITFNEEEAEEIPSLRNALNTAAYEWAAKAIVGQVEMAEWDDFQGQLRALGLERYEQIYNDAYARTK